MMKKIESKYFSTIVFVNVMVFFPQLLIAQEGTYTKKSQPDPDTGHPPAQTGQPVEKKTYPKDSQPDPDAGHPPAHPVVIRQVGQGAIGLSSLLLLNPSIGLKGKDSSGSMDCKPQTGLNIFFEYYIWDYRGLIGLTVGSNILLAFWKIDSPGSKTDMTLSIAPSLRGFYALGKNKNYEIYARFNSGPTLFMWRGGEDGTETEYGWYIKVGSGFKVKTDKGLLAFLEFGYLYSSYKDVDLTVSPKTLFLEGGLGYQF